MDEIPSVKIFLGRILSSQGLRSSLDHHIILFYQHVNVVDINSYYGETHVP